ncbi:LGFP repeat-containing protein [Streptomyces sp. ME19-01-6]|uniref:LGFP repeat-containing protein n=1 Tax=Streptomyces sp. ME19-01-6 TaxID=3028686 RepID=UPI0029B1298A|nr:DUF2599 domain-containing protein [Streptomyces sp. ME19-01-6]MDX3233779.1 DUF2599 domain-containing protein [Streptomyces sp. ME19-01-6]
MRTPLRAPRRTGALVKAATVALAAVAALTVQAPPAAADDICGRQVGGDILIRYTELGGEGGRLGCPTTDEMPTPDGRGRYNHFAGGSIYWTPETKAHAVWGAVRDKWEAMGWEKSKLGYPVGDELTNADGQGKRQQFEGGTVYWHPTLSNGAHPVWGEIGKLWGRYGWEGGSFGYPTSDEERSDAIDGFIQGFSTNQTVLWWSRGFPVEHPNLSVCTGECVGYKAVTNTEWVQKTEVGHSLVDGGTDVSVIPTEAGFEDADRNYDALWDQAFKKVPYPKGLTDAQGSSLYTQLACHARYSYEIFGGHTSGDSWDLEGYRRDVSWDFGMNPVTALVHQCNW